MSLKELISKYFVLKEVNRNIVNNNTVLKKNSGKNVKQEIRYHCPFRIYGNCPFDGDKNRHRTLLHVMDIHKEQFNDVLNIPYKFISQIDIKTCNSGWKLKDGTDISLLLNYISEERPPLIQEKINKKQYNPEYIVKIFRYISKNKRSINGTYRSSVFTGVVF